MDKTRLGQHIGRGLHLGHLNVRSLTGGHKFDILKHQIRNGGMEVFTLSETWLSESIPDKLVEIPNFNITRLDRSWNINQEGHLRDQTPKRGGGLAVYISDQIKFSDTKFKHLNESGPNLEMQWVALFLDHIRPIVVVNIYRPPQGDYKVACKQILEAFDKANMKDNTELYVMGDFNINYKDTKSPPCKELEFSMGSLGLRQLVKESTRLSFRNGVDSSTTLDLIFSNSEVINKVETLNMNLSDHLVVKVTRKKTWVKPKKIEFKGRSYRNYVKEDFQNSLNDLNWRRYFEIDDPNVLWGLLKTAILNSIDPVCPLKKFKVAEAKELWITNEALEAIRDKDKLLKKAKHTKKEEDWIRAKEARNRVGRDLENLRIDYLKDQQTVHKGDPKKFWATIMQWFLGKRGQQILFG